VKLVAVPFVVLVAGFVFFALGIAAVVSSVLAATPVVSRAPEEVETAAPVGFSTPAPAAAPTVGGGLARPTAPISADEVVDVDGFKVHRSLAADLRALLDAAEADGITLGGWGWRSHNRQIQLRRQHCGTSDYATWHMPSSQCSPPTARPGRSQHEYGLAIDFTCNGASMAGTICFRWLRANAAEFDLFNLPSEPWHWSTTGR